MDYFVSCFAKLFSLLQKADLSLMEKPANAWPSSSSYEMIFDDMTAVYLGGKGNPSLAGLFSSYDSPLLNSSGVYLLGRDIPELKGEASYAKLVLIKIKEGSFPSKESLFQGLRRVDSARYKLNGQGYAIRLSPLQGKEEIRVSIDAKKKGLSLAHVGYALLEKYLALPFVEEAKVIFITQEGFDYASLSSLIEEEENITKALDHLLHDEDYDCKSCKLLPICDQVKEKLESDFGK